MKIYEKASAVGGTWRASTFLCRIHRYAHCNPLHRITHIQCVAPLHLLTLKLNFSITQGCGCDVPSHWYSLSTELNPNWSGYFVGQPEIRAYWQALFDKYDLQVHTKFSTSVHSAEWDSSAQRYNVVLEDSVTGERSETNAEIMLYCIGGFMAPMFPKDIEGKENFSGPVWHSARWRHDVDLKGKRVGVIGNGCSA